MQQHDQQHVNQHVNQPEFHPLPASQPRAPVSQMFHLPVSLTIIILNNPKLVQTEHLGIVAEAVAREAAVVLVAVVPLKEEVLAEAVVPEVAVAEKDNNSISI